MEFKDLQERYLTAKKFYEAALRKGNRERNWRYIERMEDEFVIAKHELVKWQLAQKVISGQHTEEEADYLLFQGLTDQEYDNMAEIPALMAL